MRIGIDVRYLSHGLLGGVHTYVAHLVPALIGLAPEHEIFLYADMKAPFELRDLPGNVVVRLAPWQNGLSSVYNDLFMRRLMAQDHLSVIHFPANYGFGPAGVPTVVTLHDAINIMPLWQILSGHRKDLRTMGMMSYLHLLSRLSLRRTALILTDSQHAAGEIARFGHIDSRRIMPILIAAGPDLHRVTDVNRLDAARRQYQLPDRFILADALKNPAALIEAWRLLPASITVGKQIVFYSRRPDPLPIVREAERRGEARLLVRAPREDLLALYSMAEAFVFPSWIEGFGLPVLEAMTCGAPVIASNRGSIPEVAGDAALLVDAYDATALAENLSRVLSDAALAGRLRQQGFVRAAQFSWAKTAQQTLACYQQVALARATAAVRERSQGVA